MKRIILSLALGLSLFSCRKEQQHCYEFTSTSRTYYIGMSISEQQEQQSGGSVTKYTKCMYPSDVENELSPKHMTTTTVINGIEYITNIDKEYKMIN